MQLMYDELFDRYHGTAGEEKALHYCCIVCGRKAPDAPRNRCAFCGGAIDAIYDLRQAAELIGRYGPEGYFPLLPVKQRANLLSLGAGATPCRHARRLGEQLGLSRLFLKDETANPTRTTKDRIASVGLSRFGELGITRFVVASTGNSSTAYARAVQLVEGFNIDIFVARSFLERLNYEDHPRIRTHVVAGDFVGAGEAAKRYATEAGFFVEGGFFSLSRREGLKTAYLEAFDTMPTAPDFVFQAVSSGMGLLGAFKGALEYQALGRLSRLPALIAVQQGSCAPMAAAFRDGEATISPSHIVENPRGIASAILRGNPTQSYPYIQAICRRTGGAIMSAQEGEIRAARALLYQTEGIDACFSSATALAALIDMARRGVLDSDAAVLVNLTGGDRLAAPVPRRLIEHDRLEAAA